LLHFDVVGVAGNRRRQAGQETWYLQPGRLRGDKIHQASWDKNFLSGSIMHGTLPDAKLSEYGPTPSPVKLLDGVLLACKAERLQSNGVRFDPALGFHLYDLDFCRAAEDAGLTLGTWPIAITHASSGESIESENWIKSCQKYLSKYNEANTSP
jgi:GT2 family glycosyltransferase